MANIVKFGAATIAATAILSSGATAKELFVGVEGALLQSQVKLEPFFNQLDDPKDTSIELGLKAGYDFDTFRIWGGYSYRSQGSQKYNFRDGNGFIDGEFSWQANNILIGADYTPSLSNNFKLSLGAYTGLSIVKGEFTGQGRYTSGVLTYSRYTSGTLTYTYSDGSETGVGNLLGVKLGAIYEVVENNEIEFGIKGDYQATSIEEYDNIINYGLYVGYNYKF
ncbi:MAG: hypothetical protein SPI60_02480 [Campylobacter lanienae]|nr:hypothetical protein [Campylobacter lanienae]MDY6056656.1 hypothetical protein [Campylobacter lanienae]